MKTAVLIFLVAACYVECRKIVQVDKHANTAFINMEAGGPPKQPAKLAPAPVPTKPAPIAKPLDSALLSQHAPSKPNVPVQPAKVEPLKPAGPLSPTSHATTPGPGSVKSLINYYDSQGKASVIRPYSYAQAVKQGKQ